MLYSRLGGVVATVLATGPKGPGLETGRGDKLLMAIKILRMGSKGGGPMS
jgi:hypothetical protein